MKPDEMPYPFPEGFKARESKNADWLNPNDAYYDWPPKDHLKDADGDFCDSVWGVPDGRRGGKY